MRRALVISVLVVVLGSSGPALAKERLNVSVAYVVSPPQSVPEGLRAVAVINSGVSTQGIQQDEREAKWSVIAADMIEAMLQAGSGMTARPIMVAKRSETQAVLREHDMALAGMVAGDQAAAAGKLLAVQGLITSRILVQIEEQRNTKSTVDWMSVMGGVMRDTLGGRSDPARAAPAPPPGRGPAVVHRSPPPQVRRGPDGRLYTVQRAPAPLVYRGNPAHVYDPRATQRSAAGGGLTIKTKDVEEISRHLSVQCSFTLIDVATGQAILQYSPPPARKQDRLSPDFFFGSMLGEKELDPVDHFIGELVERATQEFVSMLVPVRVEYTYELVARHSAAEEGLRALRADDYTAAITAFEKELRKYPEEHETMFAMGVTYELMGRHEDALQWYRRALVSKRVDDDEARVYTAAKDRLVAHIGRIVPAGLPAAAANEPVGASAQPVWLQPATGTPSGPPPAVPGPAAAPTPEPGHVPAPIVEEVR